MYLELNGQTGEIFERELTDDEAAEVELVKQQFQQQETEAEAKAAARESALAKLAELGLTGEEIAAL
jgi:hypothetical protein